MFANYPKLDTKDFSFFCLREFSFFSSAKFLNFFHRLNKPENIFLVSVIRKLKQFFSL